MKWEASGSSDIDLSGYPVADVVLDMSGASPAVVNPGGTLNVKASGSSDVTNLDSPTLGNINTSGASRVEIQ